MRELKKFIPREYQQPMITFQQDVKRSAVWCSMGMGKTVTTLTALEENFLCGVDTKPALIVAPLRVAQSTWPDEIEKWEHLTGLHVKTVVGTEAQRTAAMQSNSYTNIYTTNFETIPWLVEKYGSKWPFGRIVVDESTRLKGFRLRQGTSRAKALARVAWQHPYFTELTGTPSPNGLLDLWGQVWFLDKGERLGRTFDAFAKRWFAQNYNGFGWRPMDHSQAEIQDRLRDVCLSMDAKDYFDLAEPIVNYVYIDLPSRARKLYKDLEKEMYAELLSGKIIEATNAAVCTQKCLQVAQGAMYTDSVTSARPYEVVHDLKLQALESILTEAGGSPVLVAYEFQSDIERLQKAFPKGRVLDSQPQTIRDWNAGKIPVLFAHPASAGHGLNLQDGGNILVFFGHNWNLEYHQQILERIGPVRQAQSGHDRPVFIYHIVAKDTVEEAVLERLVSKASVQDILLAAMKRNNII